MATSRSEDAAVTWLTNGDLIRLHASRAAKALGMETGEFLAKWEAGELEAAISESVHPDVIRWGILMTVGRTDSVRSN